MTPQFKAWKKFAEGKEVVTVRFTPKDVYDGAFGIKNHRIFIERLFDKVGVQITRFGHEYEGGMESLTVKKWGLCFSSIDSDLTDMYEVHAIIGVNAKRKGVVNG